jgi:hypothetical protein
MSEDLISRKAAIDAIWDGTNMDIYTREVKEILEGLPSAPPVCIAKVTFDKAEMEKIIEDLIEEIEISVTDFADRCQECGKIMNEKLNNSQQRTGQWIPVSERLPEKRGDYLITQKATFTDYVYISVAGYALNLHDVDEYDFADKKRRGWYEYDSEWGYRELDDVTAWMPLPEPYKAESEDKE